MNIDIFDLILAAAAVVAALAIAGTCVVGLVVWLAGGKLDRPANRKTV